MACGEESTSGAFWFFAASRGELLRALCGEDYAATLDEGDWLLQDGLPRDPESFDVFAALERAGFDYAAEHTGACWLLTGPDHVLPLPRGPITERVERSTGTP